MKSLQDGPWKLEREIGKGWNQELEYSFWTRRSPPPTHHLCCPGYLSGLVESVGRVLWGTAHPSPKHHPIPISPIIPGSELRPRAWSFRVKCSALLLNWLRPPVPTSRQIGGAGAIPLIEFLTVKLFRDFCHVVWNSLLQLYYLWDTLFFYGFIKRKMYFLMHSILLFVYNWMPRSLFWTYFPTWGLAHWPLQSSGNEHKNIF